MNNRKWNKFFHSLFWKISSIFLLILLILSAVYIYISVHTAEMYFEETTQKLNAQVAEYIVTDNKCFIHSKTGKEDLEKLFRSVMIINPSLEIYVLDNSGEILNQNFEPEGEKKILLNRLPLEPIKEFIKSDRRSLVLGPDPKAPERSIVFSAAELREGENLCGYLYVLLGGEEYENASQMVLGSYILKLGVSSMVIALAAALLIGLFSISFITKNVRKLSKVIKDFQSGNYTARLELKNKGELSELADAFNEMADTILKNMEEVQTMDNLRREIVANVSHDLRTPLATIHGYLETILMKADTLSEDEKRNYMEMILSSTERLKNLVDELFEFSKLEAREKKPEPEAFSIAELLQDIHQKNKMITERKGIKLSLKFPYDFNNTNQSRYAAKFPFVYADIGMMERVIQNLIDNAVKFTPKEGKIILSLEIEEENVIVKIEDTGPGIKEEMMNKIFDRYTRGDESYFYHGEGMGLGLAIVKKILEVHNIKINVESNYGSGSAFSFRIPVYKRTADKISNLT